MMSEPARVYWAGWESDTFTLQRNGWDISMDQDMRYREVRMAIRHQEARLQGFSAVVRDVPPNVGMYDRYNRYDRDAAIHGRFSRVPFEFKLEAIGQLVVRLMGGVDFKRFRPIDATPVILDEEIGGLEDLVHFTTLRPKRILLPHEEVDQLLARALEVQDPMRQKYFEEQALRGRAEGAALKAQIFTVAA